MFAPLLNTITEEPDSLVLCFLRAAQRGRELHKARADRQSTKSKRALTQVIAK